MKTDFSRREFLLQTGGTLLASMMIPTALSAADNSASAAKAAGKKAIMWDTVGVKGSILEKFKAIKEAGFDGVEMSSHLPQEEVLKARDATGLPIPSVCGSQHWGKPLSDPDPAVRAAGLEALKQTLREAKAYGASSILLVPGTVSAKVTYTECWERSVAEIRKALPLAEEFGIKIAIENVWNNFLLSPVEAARYVDEFKSPAVGWHFDAGNILVYGWPEQWIRILGARIQKIHLKEFSRKKCDNEGRWKGFDVSFLEGDNNWPEVMKALKDINYTGWYITEQGGGDSPEGLKDMVSRVEKILAFRPA
jgi:hexulose-6-phosphate isomerase